MKRYRLKLSLPGKAATIGKLFPNAFVFVAWANTDIIEKLEVADLILAQFGISLTIEEA